MKPGAVASPDPVSGFRELTLLNLEELAAFVQYAFMVAAGDSRYTRYNGFKEQSGVRHSQIL